MKKFSMKQFRNIFHSSTVPLISICILLFILYSVNLASQMVFIGDFGWFYLSARDIVLGENFPLVGIPSSHPWLHQGAFWTYLLAIALWIGNFHPVSGGYLGVLFGLLGVFSVFYVSKTLFPNRTALITAILYATSPLVVEHARMPYHTTPIPFFTTVYIYALYKWVQGSVLFFPFVIFLLAVLYNFEIATILLVIPLILIFFYGVIKQPKWFLSISSKKIIIASIGAFIIPMLPMIIYDTGHGFPQTVKFFVWMIYRSFVLLGYPQLHSAISTPSLESFIEFSLQKLSSLLFPWNSFFAGIIFISIILATGFILLSQYNRKRINKGILIIFIVFFFSVGGYLGNRIPSEAYLPILFPSTFMLVGYNMSYLFQQAKFRWVSFLLFFFLLVSNISFYVNTYIIAKHSTSQGIRFEQRLDVAQRIIERANGRSYSILAKGEGSQFKAFLDNYQYLLWWKGHPPEKLPQPLKFIIEEKGSIISLRQDEKK